MPVETSTARAPQATTRVARESAPEMVLILAAHPDDCVILGAEHALPVLDRGGQVEILYLTCGADRHDVARAEVRRAEAIRAWGGVGVPSRCLHFLNLPESPLTGPARQTADELAGARAAIEQVLRGAPAGCRVLLPAEGESHVDHRTLRRLTIAALRECDREDLQCFEVPAYNSYVSLWRYPARAARLFLYGLPLLPRLLRLKPPGGPCGFPRGERGLRLTPDAARLAQKKAMLRAFVSEDGDKLVRHHGHENYYRRLDLRRLDERAGGSDAAGELAGYVRFDGRRVDRAFLFAWLAVWTGAAAAGLWSTHSFAIFGGLPAGLAGLAAAVLLAAVAFGRPRGLGVRVAAIAVVVGAISGMFLAWLAG